MNANTKRIYERPSLVKSPVSLQCVTAVPSKSTGPRGDA
jgi:hypothetical protein